MEIDRNYFRNLFIQITHNIKNVNIITIITLVIISILILSGVNINKDFFFRNFFAPSNFVPPVFEAVFEPGAEVFIYSII